MKTPPSKGQVGENVKLKKKKKIFLKAAKEGGKERCQKKGRNLQITVKT